MKDPASIFVWRSQVTSETIFDEDGEAYALHIDSTETTLGVESCTYCGGPVACCEEHGEIHESKSTQLICSLCGWIWTSEATYAFERTSERLLREFSIDSTELSLRELGSHLRTHFADVNAISGRTFERLVSDIFANQGFRVELTKTSRDGGYDVMLLDGTLGPLIVEVKRWQKPVGVTIVRQLRGVQLREGARRAMLVTSGGFTGPARREANAMWPQLEGYGLELMDADDVLRLLSAYTERTYSLKDLEDQRIAAWGALRQRGIV